MNNLIQNRLLFLGEKIADLREQLQADIEAYFYAAHEENDGEVDRDEICQIIADRIIYVQGFVTALQDNLEEN